MKKRMMRRWLLSLLGGATAALLCAAAVAPVSGEEGDEPQRPRQTQSDHAASDSEETTVTVGSVTVGVDPRTGDIRPLSAAEAARLSREMRRLFKPRALERVARPDGTLSAIVSPNVLRFSLARIEADGTVSRTCAPGQESALEFLTRTAPKPQAGSKEE